MAVYSDVYDEWSLCRRDHCYFVTVFEGTREECQDYADSYFTRAEKEDMFLMDWEGREYFV